MNKMDKVDLTDVFQRTNYSTRNVGKQKFNKIL